MPNIRETADAAATAATAYVLTPGQTASGTLSSNTDQDGFRVTLQAGQTYTIAMVGTGPNGVQDTYLRLLGPGGALAAQDDDGGNGSSSNLTFTATQTGTYVIVAGSFNNSDRGTYGVSVNAGTRATYDNDMGAGAIQVAYLTWGGATGAAANVTWAARSTNPGQDDASGDSTPFIRASAAQIAAFQQSSALISEVCGLTFTRVGTGYSNSATILVGAYSADDASAAYANLPGSTVVTSAAGDVHLNNASTSRTSLPFGSYDFLTVLHELGHAVGLLHPGEYNASEDEEITYAQHALFVQDTKKYSIMSYFEEGDAPGGQNVRNFPDTLMMFDILALQNLYGVNNATRSSNSVYGFGANTGSVYDFAVNTDPFLCIWDGGGRDLLNASGFSNNQTLDLRAGYFSSIGGWISNVSIAMGAVIERATGGSGADVLIGNDVGNVLNGNAGADRMAGGLGNDTYYVDNVGDVVTEAQSAGTDGIYSSVSYTLNGRYVETLILTGSRAINAIGNHNANTLTGNAAANAIDGNGGADVITGGSGADIFDYNAVRDSTASAFDRITDLTNIDRIDLSTVDARTNVAGNNAFVLVDAFTGVSGQMSVTYAARTNLTTILMDTDGDRVADMKIVANGNHEDFTNFLF